MGRPTIGQIERSMSSLTIGTVRAMDDAKRQRTFEGLEEREEQIVVDISGDAEDTNAWTETEVAFDTMFVDATGQRDSEFDRPIFTYGATIFQGGPVGINACVLEWKTDKRNGVIGCTLAIGVQTSDVTGKFAGELHAVFSGYGVPVDVYGDVDSLDVG